VKKRCIAVLIALYAAVSLVAQEASDTSALTDIRLLNVGAYVSSLGAGKISDGRTIVPVKYEDPLSDDEYYSVAKLGGSQEGIDTDYEALLATYYFQKAANIRPPEAVRELPANNKTSELKMGAAAYMDMQVARFTGKDAAPYAAALKFITDRSQVSEADIKRFMAQGIAAEVDAQFNKVSFLVTNSNTDHNAILTRSANAGYTLTYWGAYTNNETRTITASTLDVLMAEMDRRKTDFDQTGINQVREQAALIPAVRLGSKALDDIVVILEQFYTRPTAETYGYLKDVYVLYENTWVTSQNQLFMNAAGSYANALSNLNQPLAQKIFEDSRVSSRVTLSPVVQQELVKLER
jgi:hypothetical protein